jgi:hypothetical protein
MGIKRQFLFAFADDCLAQDKTFSCKLPTTFKSDAAIVGKGVGLVSLCSLLVGKADRL